MYSLPILLLHLVPPSQHCCYSDMLNKPLCYQSHSPAWELTGEFPGNQKTTGTAVPGETSLSFAYLLIIGYDGAYQGYSVSSSVYCQSCCWHPLIMMVKTHQTSFPRWGGNIFFFQCMLSLAFIFLFHQHKNVRFHPSGGAFGLTETMSVCIGKGHGVRSAERGL